MSASALDRALVELSANARQFEAVSERGHCVVLAGPGSGKTRTLTCAIARRLRDDIAEPRGIACITYNNECAAELEDKLTALGVDSRERAFIGTVHGFALSQIIAPYARCVFPRFRLVGVANRAQMKAALTAAHHRVFDGRGNADSIWNAARVKRREQLDRGEPEWNATQPQLARLIEAYEAHLHRQGLIDFDDMPLLALRIVRKHQWVKTAICAKFPVLFVDEYQDLGKAPHTLVQELCFAGGITLFAVGDPDQSIYGWNGADPELLLRVARQPGVKAIELPLNYRCGTSIIDASKAALGEERAYHGPEGAAPGTIFFHGIDGDIDAQATFIIQDLVHSLTENGLGLEHIAILYRDANNGNTLAKAADHASVPIVRADKHALIPRGNRISRFIEASARWITGGWRNGDPSFQKMVSDAASFIHGTASSRSDRQEIEFALAGFLHGNIDTSASTHAWISEFNESLLQPWRCRADLASDEWDVIDELLRKTNGGVDCPDMSVQLFGGRLEGSGRLNLSTLHSAKGREFDVVVLFDMNAGAFPSDQDSRDELRMREARRLFYVGVTRARKQLHLVCKRRNASPWMRELYRRGQRSGWAE